jgi:DNA-binding FadR family transcriptional regulator
MTAYAGRGLHGQLVERIGARIVRGHYPAGAPLFAEALEAEFGVSKTVVREALRVLAAKGLVETRQKRGTVVLARESWSLLDSDVLRWQGATRPDLGFLENLAEVRSIIEPAVARLAAVRRTDADLATMEEALESMASADPEAVAAADVRFHRALLEAAHNELLRRMEVVLAAGLQMRDEFVHESTAASDSVPTHRALLEAIRTRDAELAAATVDTLLSQAEADLAAAYEAAGDAEEAASTAGTEPG